MWDSKLIRNVPQPFQYNVSDCNWSISAICRTRAWFENRRPRKSIRGKKANPFVMTWIGDIKALIKMRTKEVVEVPNLTLEAAPLTQQNSLSEYCTWEKGQNPIPNNRGISFGNAYFLVTHRRSKVLIVSGPKNGSLLFHLRDFLLSTEHGLGLVAR